MMMVIFIIKDGKIAKDEASTLIISGAMTK